MNTKTDIITSHSVEADGEEYVLADYVKACRGRRWLIVALTVGIAGTAAVWSVMQQPVYQAKATVVVEQEGPSALERDIYHPTDVAPEYFQTQFELMKSRLVLQRTAQILHLTDRPEYNPQPSPVNLRIIGMMPAAVREFWAPEKGKETSPEEREEQMLEQFGKTIEIMPIRGARLAHIIADSTDPKFAAQAANTLASVYIERTQELNSQSKGKAAEWFTNHLDGLRKKAEGAQQTLYLFRVKHGLVAGQQRQAVTAHTHSELEAELVRAEMRKAEAQSRFQQIQSVLRNRTNSGTIDLSNLDASTDVLNSLLIQNLRAQEIKTSGQVAELSDKYGPLHPKLARAKAELQDLRERIRQEIQKIVDSMKHDYESALARERAIKEAVNSHTQEKIKLEQSEVQYGILEGEAQSAQHLYDVFLKQTKEADLSAGLRSANVYLADPAVPSSRPVKPRTVLNTLLGLLVGLMTGVGLALFLHTRDRSLRGPDDVERYLPGISLLGVVPLLPNTETTKGALTISGSVPSHAAESVRIIRTNVLLSSPSKLPACVLITSPGENEGKTTLAVNLALAEAQLEGMRVILIDGDLRTPNSHPIFGIQAEKTKTGPKGLADFLSGKAELQEIMHQTEVANLWVIPKGKCPSNPSELLHSKDMRKLLNWCRQEGFQMILDAPPVLPVTDPVVLATLVDGVLLVVTARKTTREACRSAIHRLAVSGGNLLGIVVQKVRPEDLPYHYGRYYAVHDNGRGWRKD